MNARNPKHIDMHRIDLEVEIDGVWQPFTAADFDTVEYGRDLYARAVSGEFGEIVTPTPLLQGGPPRGIA